MVATDGSRPKRRVMRAGMHLVYYDEGGDPIFVVHDEDGDPAYKFGRLSRAERKVLQASLRTEFAAFNRRVEELERETEGIERRLRTGRGNQRATHRRRLAA